MEYYTFKTKVETVGRYTTVKSHQPVNLNGLDYQSKPISRSTYKIDTVKTKNNLTVMFPGDDALAKRYLTPHPGQLLLDIANRNGSVFFKGELIEARWSKNLIQLIFAPLIRIRKTIGERRIYQRNCPYELYGDSCRADKNEISVILRSVPTSRTITIAYDTGDSGNAGKSRPYDIIPTPAGGKANLGLLSGGFVKIFDTTRQWWIVNASPVSATGSVVEIAIETFTVHNIDITDTVVVALGCRHDIDDCVVVFDNLINFGGFGAMNRVSPFEGGLSG